MHFTNVMWFLQVTKSNTNPDDLGGLANQLTNEFGNLADEAKYAAMTAENDEVNESRHTQHLSVHLHVTAACARAMFITSHAFNNLCFQIGSHIKKQVSELGFSCTGLVTKAGSLQCSPNDSFTKKELIESARKVSEKVRAHPVTLLSFL